MPARKAPSSSPAPSSPPRSKGSRPKEPVAPTPSVPTTDIPNRPSPPRHPLFPLLAATLIPALFFVLLELGLRCFGYGYPSAFFLKREIHGQSAYTDNQRYTYRFFPPALARSVPFFSLPLAKPGGTYRIFVFGESAAEGDPAPAFGFSRILEAMLHDRYPNRKFEIVNTAITAVNSNVLYPIARECAKHQPDLFLIYAGNNEVIGPYGPGTVFAPFLHSLPLIRTAVALKGYRTGQLLDEAVRKINKNRGAPKGWGGMEMFLGAQVAADDPRMPAVYDHFRANLADMAELARKAGAQTLLCTVPVNWKDGGPFASLHKSGLGADQQKAWEGFYQAGIRSQAAGNYRDALNQYTKALKIDDRYADLPYRMARCEWNLGRFDETKRGFVQARDLDALRFRTDSRQNEIVRKLADGGSGKGIFLADTEAALSQASPHGILGNEMLYEHVHLNFHGNYRFAQTVLNALDKILSQGSAKSAAPTGGVLSEDECAKRLAWTDWNRFQTASEVLNRKQNPPFTHESDHAEQVAALQAEVGIDRATATSAAGIERAAEGYRTAIGQNPEDEVLKEEFGKMLLTNGRNAEAQQQYEAALERLPQNNIARTGLGEALTGQGKTEDALAAFREVLKEQPDNTMARSGLGEALMDDKQYDAAIHEFEQVEQIDPTYALPYWNIGTALEKKGNADEALAQYQKALQINPRFPQGHLKLGKMYALRHQPELALQEFQKAEQIEPDHGENFAELGDHFALEKNDAIAIRSYLLSLKVNPRQPLVEKKLAGLYNRRGDTAATMTHLERALALDPHSPETENNIGFLLAHGGQLEKALPHFQAAVKQDPQNPAYRKNLRIALKKLGRGGG